MAWRVCFLWLILAVWPSAIGSAQQERYELGKRLRRMEIAWQQADPAGRAAAVKPMQKAVESFFRFQLGQATKQLDEAYFASLSTSEISDFQRLVIAQRLEVQPVALDLARSNVQLKLKPVYRADKPADGAAPSLESSEMHLAILDPGGQAQARLTCPGERLLDGMEWSIEGLHEGDYHLELRAVTRDQSVALPHMQLSVVKSLQSRLQKIDDWLQQARDSAKRDDVSETIRLTVRQYAQIIRAQMDGRPLETDYPTVRLLRLAESITDKPSQAAEHFQHAAASSIWMTLSHQRRSATVRVHLPEKPAGEPLQARPILFAFHGAGGSENMFFETYGAGRLVELASQRGWLVVTPQQPLLGLALNYREMIDALSHFYPVDRQQVFLVGHSMGGAEVVRQVTLSTDGQQPQAAVVLGGGGKSKDVASIKATPWLVAAGELDFGRSMAKGLVDALQRLNCRCEYKEYAAVEHLLVVQAALDDVFAFLDQVKPKKETPTKEPR